MIIKVCGMKEPENIRQLAVLRPDYVGFIFYPGSKRFFGAPEAAVLEPVTMPMKRTGVFVNEEMDKIADEVIQYQLDAVQLHGDEPAEFCRTFRKYIHHMQTEKHVEIIKAFGLSDDFDFNSLFAYEDFVDYFLFDTKTSDYGGSGETFDWEILKKYNGTKPYFLSGGLSEENLKAISSIKDPRLYGIDLNSRFETAAGIKDIKKLKKIFEIIKEIDL